VGDVEAGARVVVYVAPEDVVTVTVGAGLGLPTGDADEGLGDGHWAFVPAAWLAVAPAAWIQPTFAVAGHVAIDPPEEHHDHGDHHHGSVLEPHDDYELHLHPGLTFRWQPLYASLGPEIVLAFADDGLGVPVSVRGELGVQPSEHVRVSTAAAGQVTGPERLRWHTRVGVEYLF
jgi:hypothetical protein